MDRTLLHSSTVLIWYWIVERHNTWRVMKQFGLKQIVPPPFTMPILRRERTFRSVVDYAATMDKDVVSTWGARATLGLQGEACAAAAQSEEYMEWYTKNTLMFIGRGEATEQPASDVPASDVPTAEMLAEETRTEDEPTIPQKHVYQLHPIMDCYTSSLIFFLQTVGNSITSLINRLKTWSHASNGASNVLHAGKRQSTSYPCQFRKS